MSKIHQIYRQLQSIDDPAVDRALAAAVPTADPLGNRLIGLLLLQRGDPEALLSLVLHYHRLPADIQQAVAGQVDQLFTPLRIAAGRRHGAGPANAIRIIHRAGRPPLAYLVAELLQQGDRSVRREAAACLLELADHAAGHPDPQILPRIEADQVHHIQSAIEQAMASYARHEQPVALLAGLRLLMHPMPKVREMLDDDQQPAAQEVSLLLCETDHPATCAALPLMLAVPAQRRAALAGLRHCQTGIGPGAALAQHHLLSLPEIGSVLARAADPDSLCPGPERIAELPAHELRGLPAWLATLALPTDQKIDRLAALRHAGDATTRLAALRRLMDLARAVASGSIGIAPTQATLTRQATSGQAEASPSTAPGPDEAASASASTANANASANEAIARFCDDPEPAIARIALRHLIRSHDAGVAQMLARLVNAPQPELRRFAAEQLGPIGFDRLWEAWPHLSTARRLAAGRALLKIDPHFHRHLGGKLKLSDRQARLRALALVHGLNQGEQFETILTRLAQGRDEVVASAAIKALGSAETDSARALLERALDHNDTRVRANAVEALSQVRSTEHVRKLVTMADEDANRPRANAVKQLMAMGSGEALPALQRMLTDERAEHRASALWLVEHMGLMEVARQVTEMAASDSDDPVRQRAGRVIEGLLEMMEAQARQRGVPATQARPQPEVPEVVDF